MAVLLELRSSMALYLCFFICIRTGSLNADGSPSLSLFYNVTSAPTTMGASFLYKKESVGATITTANEYQYCLQNYNSQARGQAAHTQFPICLRRLELISAITSSACKPTPRLPCPHFNCWLTFPVVEL